MVQLNKTIYSFLNETATPLQSWLLAGGHCRSGFYLGQSALLTYISVFGSVSALDLHQLIWVSQRSWPTSAYLSQSAFLTYISLFGSVSVLDLHQWNDPAELLGNTHRLITCFCLLVLHPGNISGHIRTATDLWHSRWLYSAAPLGDEAATITQLLTLSYYHNLLSKNLRTTFQTL